VVSWDLEAAGQKPCKRPFCVSFCALEHDWICLVSFWFSPFGLWPIGGTRLGICFIYLFVLFLVDMSESDAFGNPFYLGICCGVVALA
jgi:hypothetical protein